jgi:hypothetical protein
MMAFANSTFAARCLWPMALPEALAHTAHVVARTDECDAIF